MDGRMDGWKIIDKEREQQQQQQQQQSL